MKQWHYAKDNQPLGPIPEDQLVAMAQSGEINPNTLVWSEGMPDWKPYSQVFNTMGTLPASVPPIQAAPQRTVSGDEVVCNVCNQVFPRSNVIQYGTLAVCAGCKPTFLQQLREGTAGAGGSLPLAGIGSRFIAKVIDTIILWVVNWGLQIALGLTPENQANPFENLPVLMGGMVLSFGAYFIYNVLFMMKFAATPGKMALGLQIVRPDGSRMTTGQVFGRVGAEFLSSLICYIGYILAFFDPERRTLHDRLANTRVIKPN